MLVYLDLFRFTWPNLIRFGFSRHIAPELRIPTLAIGVVFPFSAQSNGIQSPVLVFADGVVYSYGQDMVVSVIVCL